MLTKIFSRLVISTFMLIASIALPTVASAEQTNKPTAIYYHADWCPNCQTLSPKFQQAISGLENDLNILIVDYSDESRNESSLKTAMEMGLFETVINNRHTGFVLMLDSEGNEQGRLYRTHSTNEIRKQLKALSGA